MSRADLGDLALVDDRVARVVAINEGREIIFELLEGVEACPTCGHRERPKINEGCLLWEQRVKKLCFEGSLSK